MNDARIETYILKKSKTMVGFGLQEWLAYMMFMKK